MTTLYAHLGLAFLFLAPTPVLADEILPSPSGEVQIVGGDRDNKSVSVGGRLFPLNDLRADLLERVGNLILVGIYTGGTACPALYAWLDTTPGQLGLTESFGTCSDLYELIHDQESVTLIMPSFDASEGHVAFIYDGHAIYRKIIGLKSSAVASAALDNVDALIGASPYEYLTAKENEAMLIQVLGWDSLDALRNTTVLGSQKMTVDGDWIVGEGCRPHMCNTDFAAIAIHRKTGELIAAIKSEGIKSRLLGEPPEALPSALRAVMVSK
jgi:hypothetical protein